MRPCVAIAVQKSPTSGSVCSMRGVVFALMACAVWLAPLSAALGSPAAVVVWPSASSFEALEDSPLDVRYTAVNEGPGALDNAVLELPQPAGFVRAEPPAMQWQGRLVWGIGPLLAGDQYTVRVLVEPPKAANAVAAGTLRGTVMGRAISVPVRGVSLDVPAGVGEYLLATPDADPTDPPVALAAAREAGGSDPLEPLFRFVRDEVRLVPSRGSLLGARGALYEGAANATDKANLLVALLRAQGIPAGYRRGVLSVADATARFSAIFPPLSAQDLSGVTLTPALLRADLEATLALVPAAALLQLGATRASRLAALAALADAELMALVAETTTPSAGELAALRDHTWVEAFVNGTWVALDPSLPSNGVGTAPAVESAPQARTAAIPEGVRHRVVVRVARESYEPAWGQGPTLENPSMELAFGAGDLVGRSLAAFHRLQIDTTMGFFFFSQTTRYTPTVEVRDLERRDRVEVSSGEVFEEFTSNFGGNLTDSFVTAVFVEVELLEPGQSPGQGKRFVRALADRFDAAMRAGAGGGIEGNLAIPSLDVLDAAAFTISAARAPGRLAEASQALLTAVATEAEGEAQALEAMPGADPPPSDALARARGFASQLTETLSLLYEANLGARLRLLGQTKRQLPYSREPRVVAVAARVPGTGDPAVLSVDLMHETTASVGAPGQPRRDRRAFASAYGLAATDIESALLESVVGPEVVSTGRVFAAALDAEVPFVLLQGTSGVNALASDAYALSAEARFRMLAALEAGSAILAPTASSLVNGTLRAAWYEIGSDGSIIGKLDDGSGGVAIEYALNLYSFACATALKCPKNQYTYTANISKFTGYLWGLITSSLDAAFACSFGAQKICEKLTTKFAEVPGKVLALAGEALQLQGWGIETGFDCVYPFDGVPCGDVLIPPCVAVDILIEGYCNFIAGFAEADKMVKAALADPLLTGLPGGAVDPNPTPPGARHLAETTLQSLAVLSPANVSATVSAASVRAVGPVEVQSPSAAVALRARKIALGDAVVTAEAPATAPSGASDLEWRGIDLHVPVLGAADASWTGVAALDAVSSAGSLRVGATFGEPTTGDEESLGAVQLGGGVSALFDTLSASAQAAGELVVGGGALVAGRYGVGADGLAAAAMCVTAASEAEVVVAAPDAVVTLTLAVGSLQVGGFVVSAGESVSLRSPAGSVALAPTSPASDALAASLSFPSAQWSRLALGQPSPGVGPFVIPVAVQSTQAEPYTVRAAADAGWQLEFQDGALVAVPPAGLPSGPAPIAIEAIGLSGARASATLTLDVQVPAQPTPSVAIVEDPRYSTDLLGWRTSALQVEVRHAGPAPAEYALAVQVDPPLFAVDVAQTSVWVEPGGVRRVGLALRVPEGTAMLPPAGATVVVRATVSGPATAFGEWAWEMPPVSSFVLAAEPRVVALAPGSETEVVVRLRSTGNVPAPVGLSVDAPSALEVAIAPVGAPVQPGAEVSTTAVVKALALGQSLPRSHMLRVQRPATPFEQERGLTPPAATVQVAVVAPGGEALALALAEAQGAGQPAVATALALALDAHTRASQACDDAALATLAAAFGTLEAALMGNPATAAAAEAVQAAQVALDGTGCAGLVDLAGLLAPVGEVALLPDLVVGVAGPATVQNGAPVPLSINVLNAGGAPSVATEVELFLRKGSSRTLLHVAPVGALGTGQGLELPFVFDSSALLGSAVLEATVDGAGLLAEVSETNNIGVDVLEVLPKGNAPSTNAPPEFLNFPGSPVQAGTPFEFAPEVVDPDGDVVSLDLIAKPKGLSFDGTTLGGTFSTPGELTLHWVAMDVWGALTEQKMPITVVPPGFSNAPPLFTGPSAAAVVVGVPLELKFEAFDPEGGAVEFALVTGPEGAQLEPAGANAVSLTFVPTAQQVGSHVVSLRATDALGAWVARAIAVRVNAEPAGPNLRLGAVSAAAVTWLSSGTRDGALELEVANTGDAPAAATALRVWEEGDDEPGFGPGDTLVATAPVPALPAGGTAPLVVDVAGPARFAEAPLFVDVDPSNTVKEAVETDNSGSSAQPTEEGPWVYPVIRPVPDTVVAVLGQAAPATVWVVEPASGATLEVHQVEPGTLVVLVAAVLDGAASLSLDQFVVLATSPVVVSVNHEILEPNYGGDTFHPALDGRRVGRDFLLYVPTVTPNNRLVVVANEDAAVVLRDAAGGWLDAAELSVGQWWEPQGLSSGQVLRLESTGDVLAQSCAVTGASAVPPVDRECCAAGDVGRRFRFSTRERGPGGGAVAVMAYDDAQVELRNAAGEVLWAAAVAAGEVAFASGLGEQRALELEASGDVAVMAGDMSAPGADTIDWMGEDLTVWRGAGGTSFVVHSQAQVVGDTTILAGALPVALRVNGAASVLPAYGALPLADGQVYSVLTSSPVLIAAQGGGDRYFDMGTVVPAVPRASSAPRGVLHAVTLSPAGCTGAVKAMATLCNAGGAALVAGGEVQLVRATAASNAGGPLAVVQLWTLPKPLPSGFCTAVALEVASAGATSPSDPVAWALRWQPADAADQVVVATGGGPLTAAPCGNGAPVFVSVPPASLVASTDLAYVAQAVDPEGQPVTYTLLGGPAGAALEPATGLLTWTPPASAVEKSASFVILAADPQGETAAQAFSLSLPPTPPCSGSADADGDGACPPLDCAPGDPSVGPAVVEVLGDGIDNDCSPLTPDALPLGAVQLEVAPEASQVPPGAQTRLLWLVRHTGANVVPAGLDVVLTVSCGALAPSQLQADVAGIAPGGFAAGTSSFEVPAGAGGNTCEVSGEVMAGTVSLASASASFAVVSAATGSISAEPSAVLRGADARLSFSVGNAPPEAAVVVRAGARVLATTTAAATPQTVAVDTSGFEPAAHPVALEVDGTEVARTVLQVGLPTRLEIARGVGEAGEWWQGAASSTIEFRPLGPLPGAPAVGSRLFGYWEASHVQLGIEPADPSADPTDRLRVELLGADEVFIVMNWERAGGSSTSHPEVATSVDTLGELIEITVPASLLPPLEQGAELRLRVTLVDAGTPIEGQLGTVRDVRQWATRAEAEPVVDAFGTLVLGPSDNGEPGDSDASTGESDATSDAGSPEGGGGSGGEATNDGLVGDDDASGDPASSEGSGEGGCGGCHTGPGGGSALGHLGLAALVLGAWWQLRAARRRRLPRRWLTLLLVLGGWGCGSDDAGSSSGSAADAQGGAESAEDGGTSGLSDTQGGAGGEDGDGGDGESSSDADGGSAQPTDAGPADADTADPDGGSPGAGAPLGAACDVAADCASGICLPGAAVGTCSVSCELYVCPDGWGCSTFPGGGKACVPAKTCLDADKDGFGVGRACAGGDCDDSDASVAPNKGELCNGKDDDCDGEIDEGVANACGGCGALPPEVCNGFDDDCDGAVDEGVTNACGGCGPAGSEVCNGFDDDCDGTIDLGVCGVCAPGEQEPCFAGMPEQAGVGPCVVGVRTCEDGVFGACVGSGIPSGEVCNGQDDNCDGSTDEGVSNACGGCGPTQTEVCNGLDDDCDGATDEGVTSPCGACTPCGQALIFPAEAGVVSPTLSVAPDGAVTLGAGQVKRNFIWVPNSAENSVSRWSTVTGREEGRFYVGLDPSRTAIDLDGNAWVGHRGDGKLTRLISRPEDCIDRNGDGVIQTSRDLNGDGRITFGEVVNTLADPLADECVQCQVQVGPGNDLVRGVAVDDDNFVWAGTWNSQKIVKIDPDTCEIVLEVPTSFEGPPLSIYGLAIDGAGSLWTSTFSDPCILRIDTDLGVAVQRVCANVGYRYGLAVDGKNHVWFANWGSAVMRYRPEADAWDFFDSPEQLAESTGVVVGIDGSVFVAAYANHRIARLAPESGTWTFWDTAQNWADQGPQYNPRGVTIDEDGDIWAICRGSSSLVEFSAVGEPKGAYPIRSATNPNAGTGPYSYSDNTGFQLFTFTATEGSWSVVFDAEQPVDYVALEYSAHQPVGTSVAVQLRYAMPGEALQLAEYSPESVENPLLLAGLVPPGAQRVEARFWLRTSEPTTKPVLRDVRFLFETPPCIGQDAVACPSGQQCEQVFGGCVVQPVDCAQDFACDAAEFCNAQGKCQQGCRTSPDNCGVGATCDASSRLCKQKAGECATDSGCAAGSYCSAVGTCEPGCRTEPDSCPPAFSCDAQSRACAPLPPECSTDAECPPSAYCAAAGKCLLGCRLGEGGCPDGLVCSALLRTCGAAPQGCTPGAPKPEACNGGDDDCNGVIDDGTALMGETCAHGALAGVRACWNGRPVCKLEPVPGPGAPTLEGPLEDLWLHGGAYAVVGTLGMRGTVVLDAGVTLTGLQDGAAAVVSEAAHDLVWAEDATLERMSIAVAGEAHASLLGVEVLGRSGGNNFAECGGAATCALFGCTVRDAELRSSAAAELTVEYSKLISDDTAFRHLMVATGARTTVRFVEGQGRNALPRPHMGAYVAGAFEMQGSSFGTLQIGARVLTTADVVLTDSAFVSCDAGVQVEGASRPVLIAVHIDDTDPGHPGIGVRFEGLSEVGGAVVNGLSFATDSLDRPLWLDPDNFRPNGISTWQGLDFGGHPEATRARLSGAAVGGALTFDSIVGVNRFELADWVSLWGVQAVVEPGLTFASRLPDQADFRLHAGAGTKLQFLPSATLDHVGCQVDAGAEVQAEGLACRYALGPERRCFDISGVLELKDCTLQSEVLPTGPERRFVGVEARAGSAVSVVDTAFERLRAGVFLHGGAEVSVLGSHFESVQRPLWAIGVSTLGPIEAVTITDADPLLASVGVTLQFEPPGVAELVSVAFDLGAEDVALAVDPDVFAKSSPSSFGALTQSNGAPVRPALFGVAEASALELQSATPLELLLLDTVDFRFGGATKVGPNITLFAPDGVSRLLRVLDPGTTLELSPGATLRNLWLQIDAASTLHADGATFESTDGLGRDMLRVWGTAELANCAFVGTNRVHNAAIADAGGSLSLESCTFVGCNHAILAANLGSVTAQGCSIAASQRPLSVGQSGKLVCNQTTIADDSPVHGVPCIETWDPRAGMVLDVANTHFEVGADDAPFQFHYAAFRQDATVQVKGSTFENDFQGLGYLLWGEIWENIGINLAHVELAQPDFRVNGTLFSRFASTVSIAPGTRLRALDEAPIAVRAIDTSAMHIDGVEFRNVVPYWEGASQGSLTNSLVESGYTWFLSLSYVTTPGAVTMTGNTFRRSAPAADKLGGVRVEGGPEVAPALIGNSFQNLLVGVQKAGAPSPVLSGNTFEGCVTDVSEP